MQTDKRVLILSYLRASLRAVSEMIISVTKSQEFKSRVEKDLKNLVPLVEEMKHYNDLLDRPREEIERVEHYIRDAQQLVRKSAKLNPWNFLSYQNYQTKFKKKEDELKKGREYPKCHKIIRIFIFIISIFIIVFIA